MTNPKFLTTSSLAIVAACLVAWPAQAQVQQEPVQPSSDRATSPSAVPTSQAEAASTDAQSSDDVPVAATSSSTVPNQIVVTGSRITTSGYQAPTPVTVIGEELLQRDAKVSIGDSIRELPAVGTSASPNNGSGAGNIVSAITGLDTVNLRQLGINRTLVLFDGQRVVQSNITGGVDLGLIPSVLVNRIDVVTGGASAAWGSDAVAGVVNLVLNTGFEGIRASVEGGESYKFDHKSYRMQLAAGTGFNDDRGRVIIAGNYLNSPDTVFGADRPWNRHTELVYNPNFAEGNGQPRLIHADFVGLSQATLGGLIVDGPLRGTQFVGPDATPTNFDFGNISAGGSNGGDANTFYSDIDNLTVAYRTRSLFGYLSYELTDNLQASLQLNYGDTRSRNNSVPFLRAGNQRIRTDNAFLPEETRQQLLLNGYQLAPCASGQVGCRDSFLLGTTNLNNVDNNDLSLDAFAGAVGIPVNVTKRDLKRAVFSLDGTLGNDWSWNAYYQIGKVNVNLNPESNVIRGNYALAVDAVVDPATGGIVCRSTLTDPGNGCAPLNIFGVGVASQAGIDYVNTRNNFEDIRLKQQVAAASMQGILPFGLAAGNIAVAFGAEYRKEEGVTTVDPGAAMQLYSVGNFSAFSGEYDVKEAFLETEIPILEDSFIQALSLNAAGRVTNYSTSGTVVTWKVGVTGEINNDVRLRGTISRDIRAPNLAELFNTGTNTQGQAIDPNTGNFVTIFSTSGGNPDLTPEIAKTYSAGIVLSPIWLSGFRASVDYYQIVIDDAIYTVGTSTVLDRCNAGQTIYCSQLQFAGPNGALSRIFTRPLNVSSEKTSGIDFQADYTFPLFSGDVLARFLGNYVLGQSQDVLGQQFEYAGSIGPDSQVQGIPRFRSTASLTYSAGPATFTVQNRLVGAAKLRNDWGPLDVDDNSVPAIAYFDLRGQYELSENFEFFAAVDNLGNKSPPNVAASPTQGFSFTYFTPVEGRIHDTVGRSYRIGLRFRY